MINGKSVLGVIAARGGSKRVPRKNLREFRGKSLLEWAILSTVKCKYFDAVVVSTEDEEIREKAKALMIEHMYGYNIVNRPEKLATDTTSSEDVLRHALIRYPMHWVVLLQPTSPLRTAEDIDACIERAQMGNGCISTDLSGVANGAVYVATSKWLRTHDFSHLGLMKYRMPDDRCLDINYEADFA